MRRAAALLAALPGCIGAAALIAGCAQRQAAPAPAAASAAVAGAVRLGSDGRPVPMHDGTPIDKVGFRPGVSSATVERMGRDAGCTGGVGAGLVTEAGPVEVYRMTCDNGKTFMARCELRQCRPMAKQAAPAR